MNKTINVDYNIVRILDEGNVLIEYKSEGLGKIIKNVFLPFDKTEDQRLQMIKDATPRVTFYGRLLAGSAIEPSKGSFSVQVDDHWFNNIEDAYRDSLQPYKAPAIAKIEDCVCRTTGQCECS